MQKVLAIVALVSVVLLSSCYHHHTCATYADGKEVKKEKIELDENL